MLDNIKYNTKFVDFKNSMFHFIVMINDQSFDYQMGVGHCTKLNNDKTSVQFRITDLEKDDRVSICKAIYGHHKTISMWDYDQLAVVCIKRPKLSDVLNCLFMDSEARNTCFEDWCSDFGYSDDSIKARDIYNACIQNAIKLKKALGDKYSDIKKEIEELND